jgi:hypothetical protein
MLKVNFAKRNVNEGSWGGTVRRQRRLSGFTLKLLGFLQIGAFEEQSELE